MAQNALVDATAECLDEVVKEEILGEAAKSLAQNALVDATAECLDGIVKEENLGEAARSLVENNFVNTKQKFLKETVVASIQDEDIESNDTSTTVYLGQKLADGVADVSCLSSPGAIDSNESCILEVR